MRRTKLLFVLAAVRGICAGTARAVVEWLLS